jgi:UDP-N-acetylmuramoylalanine--D-glutamate ligase
MKKRIFNHHTENDVAVLNLGDEEVLSLTSDIKSTKKYFASHSSNDNGCSIVDGYICYNNDKIIALDAVKIKGMHNYENAMAAIVVSKELGVDNEAIVAVLTTFGGVEHRIEYVKTVNDREFYNDSKATNVTSTQIALASFTKPTILLLGGLDRGHSFDDLKDYLKHVKLIVSYGETRNRINDFAKAYNIPCEVVDTLEEATYKAFSSSDAGDVILLSPACASWDQFKDFEIRGDSFKEYVNKL